MVSRIIQTVRAAIPLTRRMRTSLIDAFAETGNLRDGEAHPNYAVSEELFSLGFMERKYVKEQN